MSNNKVKAILSGYKENSLPGLALKLGINITKTDKDDYNLEVSEKGAEYTATVSREFIEALAILYIAEIAKKGDEELLNKFSLFKLETLYNIRPGTPVDPELAEVHSLFKIKDCSLVSVTKEQVLVECIVPSSGLSRVISRVESAQGWRYTNITFSQEPPFNVTFQLIKSLI